jgi:hypothetical protein
MNAISKKTEIELNRGNKIKHANDEKKQDFHIKETTRAGGMPQVQVQGTKFKCLYCQKRNCQMELF